MTDWKITGCKVGAGLALALGVFGGCVGDVNPPETEVVNIDPADASMGGGSGAGGTGGAGTVCGSDDFQCVQSALQLCNNDGTGWITRQMCNSAELCQTLDPATLQALPLCLPPTCVVGDFRCNPDNPAELQTCNEGLTGWMTVDTCESAAHCSASARECADAPCSDGQFQCSGTDIQRCDQGLGWVSMGDPCATPGLCQVADDGLGAECTPPVCDVGTTRCNPDAAEFQRCNASRSGWITESLCTNQALCDDDAGCVDEMCEINEYQCAGEELQACNATQTGFETIHTCLSAAHCDATNFVCTEAPCMPGAVSCNGNVLRRCNETQTDFDVLDTCATGALCNLADPVTLECPAPACGVNEQRCNGTALQRCNAGRTGLTQLQVCATEGLCLQSVGTGACVPPECSPGQHRCRNDAATGSTVLEMCNPGRNGFDAVQTCPSEDLCNADLGQCSACEPGTYECSGAILSVCDPADEVFEFVDGCDSAALCRDDLGQCTDPACDPAAPPPNGRRCNGSGNLERCRADRTGYEVGIDCQGAQVCDAAGNQCDNCVPDAARCQGDTRIVCSPDGQTELTQNCGPDLCDPDGCLVCTPGAFSCNTLTNSLRQCNAAGSGTDLVANCGAGTCNAAAEQCCSPNAFICDASGNLNQCAPDGRAVELVTECGDLPCDPAGGRCGTCLPGSPTCTTNDIFECNDAGTFVHAVECGVPGCDAGDTTCDTCVAGVSMGCGPTGGVMRCNADGRTIDEIACPAGRPCNASTGECALCVANAFQSCQSGNVTRCNAAGTGFDTESCNDGIVCTVDACSTTLQACTHSPDATMCSPGFSCDVEDGCVCDPNEFLDCATGTAQLRCADNGTSTVQSSCGTNLTCSATFLGGAGGCGCMGGAFLACMGTTSQIRCNTGGTAANPATACIAPLTCGGAGCGCTPNAVLGCSGTTRTLCNADGTGVMMMPCGTNLSCQAGNVCGCTAGAFIACSGTDAEITCNAGGTAAATTTCDANLECSTPFGGCGCEGGSILGCDGTGAQLVCNAGGNAAESVDCAANLTCTAARNRCGCTANAFLACGAGNTEINCNGQGDGAMAPAACPTFLTCDAAAGGCACEPGEIVGCNAAGTSEMVCNGGGNMATPRMCAGNMTCGANGCACADPDETCCVSQADCEDENPCTTDSCAAATGQCTNTPIAPSATNGCCTTVADCNDGNVCTNDSCSTFQCVNQPNTASCDDGNACTGNGTCAAMSCTPGTVTVNCNDDVACTVDSTCDPDTGECTNTPNNALCSPGLICDPEDDCVCPADAADCCLVDADCPSLSCTANVCDPVDIDPTCEDGIQNQDETAMDCGGPNCGPCEDGETCSLDGDCFSGSCLAGTCVACDEDADCDDADACNLGACGTNNLCTTEPSPDPLCCVSDADCIPLIQECDLGANQCVTVVILPGIDPPVIVPPGGGILAP